MDPKLQAAYTERVLLQENKQPKKTNVVKHLEREYDMEDDVKLTTGFKSSGASAIKGLKKPEVVHTKDTPLKKASKLNDSLEGSKFDQIFRKALVENTEGAVAAPAAPAAPAVPGTGEPVGLEGEDNQASEASGLEGDVVSDLTDVVTKLHDILVALGGEVPSEESASGEVAADAAQEGSVNSDIDKVEGQGQAPATTNEQSNVQESLADLKTAIHGLKTKLNSLTGKTNKVASAIKVSSGRADTGDSVDLKPAPKTDLHSKGQYTVNTKLKTGRGLFDL